MRAHVRGGLFHAMTQGARACLITRARLTCYMCYMIDY